MNSNLTTVVSSCAAVFGLLGVAWLYSRRTRPDFRGTLRLGMDLLVPCLAFTSILDSRIAPAAFGIAAGATAMQIGVGLLAGLLLLRAIGRPDCRDLLLPIAFVNSANLPFPLLLANFGQDGLAVGVVCYTVTNLAVYPAGVLLLRDRAEMRSAFREPALWATAAAGLLRLLEVRPPEAFMQAARIAAAGAVPIMLVLFGDSLARTRPAALRLAVPAVLARYLSGLAAMALTLAFLRPSGLVRPILILYALLPPAMVNVILVRNSGRDEQATAAAVLIGTLLAVGVIPAVLLLAR
jgi:predicted permease